MRNCRDRSVQIYIFHFQCFPYFPFKCRFLRYIEQPILRALEHSKFKKCLNQIKYGNEINLYRCEFCFPVKACLYTKKLVLMIILVFERCWCILMSRAKKKFHSFFRALSFDIAGIYAFRPVSILRITFFLFVYTLCVHIADNAVNA
jgi:hypothetical protein